MKYVGKCSFFMPLWKSANVVEWHIIPQYQSSLWNRRQTVCEIIPPWVSLGKLPNRWPRTSFHKGDNTTLVALLWHHHFWKMCSKLQLYHEFNSYPHTHTEKLYSVELLSFFFLYELLRPRLSFTKCSRNSFYPFYFCTCACFFP